MPVLGGLYSRRALPHVNNTEQFLNGRRRRWWRTVGLMVAKLSTPVLAVVAAAWWSWGRKSTFLIGAR